MTTAPKPKCGALYTEDSVPCQLDAGHYRIDRPGVSPHVAHSPYGNGHTIEFVPLMDHDPDEPRWIKTWDSQDRRLPDGAIAPAPMSLWFTGYAQHEGDAIRSYQVADQRASRYGQIDTGIPTFHGMSVVEKAALRALCERAIRMLDDTDALEQREREAIPA